MDYPGINELLIVTEAQLQAVRETYNATSESLTRDIDSLIEWYKLQPHLPQIELDRVWLERLLIANKCSVQRSKNKIDMLISSRNAGADFFLNRDPEKMFKNMKKILIMTYLPKLMPDNTRVSLYKFTSDDGNLFNHMDIARFQLLLLDYEQMHDYSVGDRYVMDIRGFNSSMITKLNPLISKRLLDFARKAYGNRVTSIHIVFATPILESLLKFFKLLLPPKLAGRLKVHSDLDSLYQDIPREILPKEYGGEDMTSEGLFEKWEYELCSEKQLNYFKDLENIRSDESKRIVEVLNDDNFGVAGSFRSLNLD